MKALVLLLLLHVIPLSGCARPARIETSDGGWRLSVAAGGEHVDSGRWDLPDSGVTAWDTRYTTGIQLENSKADAYILMPRKSALDDADLLFVYREATRTVMAVSYGPVIPDITCVVGETRHTSYIQVEGRTCGMAFCSIEWDGGR